MNRLPVIILLSLSAASAVAQGPGPYQVAETGKTYGSLQRAVDAIGDDEGTIIISPGTYRECAVQTAGSISYRAAIPGQTVFDKRICEDKAAIVLRGVSASVDGIIFQNMFSQAGNAAGLRLETGALKVTRVMFRDSQQGILTAHDPNATLSVDQSTFTGLGLCDVDCAHSIYGGHIASVTVTNSRFERGTGGHYVKFRGKRVSIRDNAFDDSRGRATNYMIDLPNGATGVISGNVFVQGANKENSSAFIAVAAEEKQQTSAGLAVNNNDASIVAGVKRDTVFLADWSNERLSLGANRLGRGLTPFERR